MSLVHDYPPQVVRQWTLPQAMLMGADPSKLGGTIVSMTPEEAQRFMAAKKTKKSLLKFGS